MGKNPTEIVLGDGMTAMLNADKSTLVITVNLKSDLGASKSGKSRMVATTGGNVGVAGCGGLKIGLNAYRPA